MKYFQDPAKLWPLLSQMLEGTGNTLLLFALTLLFALPLGYFVSRGSMTKIAPVKWITRVYILLMRGTPLMLQVMFCYFGLNILGLRIDRFLAGVLAFALNYTAYFSEIYRGGIQSIERGQYEAADVLGLKHAQTMRKIILPQVVKRILPAMGNEIITLVKDTALVSVIAVSDLMQVSYSVVSREASVMPFFIAALFYLIMNGVVTRVLSMIEKRYAYYR